ncbi:MAG: hypothetical protein KIG95_01680 [Comamonas sp.]|nr:hypothetical protein [Comamonas sp.]
MPPLENADWKLLKHLHQQITSQQAQHIEHGGKVQPQAYLVSPGNNGAAQLAELSTHFIQELLSQEDGQQQLAKYLADALRPGSDTQQHIAQAYGFNARYTLSCQEATLPQADGSQQPVLMVLLHGQGFALPVFHTIEEHHPGRRCQLRPFPELAEIQAVQDLLQQRLQQGAGSIH